jgi:hypothetical protein
MYWLRENNEIIFNKTKIRFTRQFPLTSKTQASPWWTSINIFFFCFLIFINNDRLGKKEKKIDFLLRRRVIVLFSLLDCKH